jgi:uncharacterized glyoxalase superfamily metalloenzyme YdcJ
MSGASADLHEKIRRLPVLSAHLKAILSQEALSNPFKVFAQLLVKVLIAEAIAALSLDLVFMT